MDYRENSPFVGVDINVISIFPFDANFQEKPFGEWLRRHWCLPLVCFTLYLVFIFYMSRCMERKAPLDLRVPLILWNTTVAALNPISTINLTRERLSRIQSYGWRHSVCTVVYYNGSVGFGGSFMVLAFRIGLLGDTVFMLLRKQPIPVIHWGHHSVSVLYNWYMMANEQVSKYLFCLFICLSISSANYHCAK